MLGRGEQGECGRAGISPRSLSSSSAGNTPAPKPISAGAAWGSRFMSMIDICLSCVFCVCVCLLAFLRVLVQGMAKRDANRKKKRQAAAEQEYEVAQAEGIAVDRRGVVEGRDGVAGDGGGGGGLFRVRPSGGPS